MDIPALPFSENKDLLEKPIKGYPQEIISIGDHIRARRLALKLFQDDAARLLEVSTDTVTGWETGRSEPMIYHYPLIIEFLGYNPFNFDSSTLKGRIEGYRQIKGLSQKKLGELLDCNASTIASWEKGEHEPNPKTLLRLNELLSVIS